MGLDMYLTKKTYIGNQYREPKKMVKVLIPKNQDKVMFPTKSIINKRITYIEEEIGYWRKANQIHAWFVDNVQDGEDDCKEYIVNKERLQELLDLVNKVLKNNKLAEKLLPVKEGFFFGNNEYNEYYFEDLRNTKDILEQAIKEYSDCSANFYYSSSW